MDCQLFTRNTHDAYVMCNNVQGLGKHFLVYVCTTANGKWTSARQKLTTLLQHKLPTVHQHLNGCHMCDNFLWRSLPPTGSKVGPLPRPRVNTQGRILLLSFPRSCRLSLADMRWSRCTRSKQWTKHQTSRLTQPSQTGNFITHSSGWPRSSAHQTDRSFHIALTMSTDSEALQLYMQIHHFLTICLYTHHKYNGYILWQIMTVTHISTQISGN